MFLSAGRRQLSLADRFGSGEQDAHGRSLEKNERIVGTIGAIGGEGQTIRQQNNGLIGKEPDVEEHLPARLYLARNLKKDQLRLNLVKQRHPIAPSLCLMDFPSLFRQTRLEVPPYLWIAMDD